MPRYGYRLYGILLESDTPLHGFVPISSRRFGRAHRVVFKKRRLTSPPRRDWISLNGFSCWISADYKTSWLRFPRVGDFRVYMPEKTIEWRPCVRGSSRCAQLMSRRILGYVLPHLKPMLVLHACVVVVRGKAVAFLGASGHGKSTLGAAFLRDGYPLLSDDVAVFQRRGKNFILHPSSPEIRLWPDAADCLAPRSVSREPVYPEISKEQFILDSRERRSFVQKPVPVEALYVLHRKRRGAVKIETLKGQEALLELCGNSYNHIPYPPAIARQQFKMVAQLVYCVPIRRLVYPSGLSHLPSIRQAILRNLSL